ncbi:M15 family metallopeptidase [Streptomyces sp. BK79]|uniref:M15 family metallopeptidase n=1 Tax=Streptomyces sp. BK79 TaxID=3350097 RepID=UPI00376FC007
MHRPASTTRSTTHRTRRLLAAALTAVTAVLVTACDSHAQKPSGSRSSADSARSSPPSPSSPSSPSSSDAPPSRPLGPDHGGEPREATGGLGEADGVVPDGVTVFDDAVPAVAELDEDLLDALRRAATAAADDHVAFHVNSGWRSRAYQDLLRREAVAEYGSEEEAARWVATAETSPHVSGDAVDLGPSDATAWLSRHGAEYGLCQIYRNEPWHYELRPEAADDGCPTMYAEPTQDPRMQQ